MKTKNSIFSSLLAIFIVIFIITGCKKNEDPAPTPTPAIVSPTDSTSQTTRASDQSNVENESNQAMDEANSAMGQVSTTREVQAICGYTIDSSLKAQGKITLIYDGTTNCSGKTRSGKIFIELPVVNGVVTRMSTAGATAKLTFENYKIINVATNKSIEFNGFHTVTDSTGYTDTALYLGTIVVYKIRGNVQITFTDGTSGTWNTAKRRILDISVMNNIASVSVSGDTVINNYPGKAAFWGINRVGDSFTVTVPTPVEYKVIFGTCLYRAKGVVKYYWLTHEITVRYGVTNLGFYPDPAPCPWGYSIEWQGGNANIQYIY